MLQFGQHPHFPQEPVGHAGPGQFGPEHLEGDRPMVPDVGRKPDARHATLAEFPLDGVAVTELGFQDAAQRVRHGGRSVRTGGE